MATIESVEAARAIREPVLEAYRQRLVAADSDPTNYSPDYTEREGVDSNEDGFVWSVARRQWIDTIARRLIFPYRASTSAGPDVSNGYVLWFGGASQITATHVHVSHRDSDGVDLDRVYSLVTSGSRLFIQEEDLHDNAQQFTVSGTPELVVVDGGVSNYWKFPVTLISSDGTGTTGFSNNRRIVLYVVF